MFCCGVPVVVTENPEGGIFVTWADGQLAAKSEGKLTVWGGCDSYQDITTPIDLPYTSVTVNSGELTNVFGSNRGPGTIDKVTVIINGGTMTQVAAAIGKQCSFVPNWKSDSETETVIKDAYVTANGGTVSVILYGGSGSGISNVGTTHTIVNGGTINYVVGGSSNGTLKKSNLIVNGGDIGVCSSHARGTVGDVNMTINDGTINILTVSGDRNINIAGDVTMGVYGGTVETFAIYEDLEITPETNMENMKITYVPGTINEEDIVNAPVEIKVDLTRGEGAEMKTVRIYPFPHQSNNIFGVLIEGMPIDKPAELPMTEQEIRMCLGMAQMFEVVGDKLVLLDVHNYNQDNSDAPEFTGELPCDDCEMVYPRDEEKEEEVVVQSVRTVRKSSKKKSTYVAPADIEDEVAVAAE